MELFNLNLDSHGAPDFSLSDRADFSGHASGKVDPHLNADLKDPNGSALRWTQTADFRDLVSTQLPDFNGMQQGCD